jgi:adenosine deaminase
LENNRDQFPAKIDEIIKFLLPIASDPCLSEDNSIETPIDEETTNYKSSFGFRGKERKSIFEIIEEVYPLRESEVLPEVALLDPNNSLLDERARFFPEYDSSHYFQSKKKLKKMGVTYDEIMLVFLILLYIRDECKINEQQNGLRKLRDEVLSDLESALNSKDQELNRKVIVKNTSNFINLINNRHDIASTVGAMKPTNNIIHFLQSAHSTKRCIDQTRASLFNYLRGCEYAGAAHLQSKASIYLTIRSIVEDYAIQDKIRYLCLRCSVDGYSKFGLQPNENIAMENLLKAISFYTNKACREGNKIRVNVIVTAKRHKSLKEFDKNAALALKYRFGLDKQGESSEDQPAFPGKPKVVSFDLAGKEKKYPTIKFLKNFQPLLEKCFPITIHAGEEEDKDAIWDAVYHVHTQRIGHALSLRQDDRLLDIVRERHIAIELCPLSNVLTNGRYKFFEETKIKEELDKCDTLQDKVDTYRNIVNSANFYPLRQYLDENLDVTVNTDNPFVSDSNMTKEYLVAARLTGGLSRWEILRLIKNGFRAAAIPKDEKRKLMNEIDDEIYEILQNEDL